MLSLSILVPVYNEQYLVEESLLRLRSLCDSPHLERVQVIVVDDCSRDDTQRVLARFELELANTFGPKFEWLFLRHDVNSGKGAAIRTALEHAHGDVTVIHDADLEYHPQDLLKIVEVFATENADAVFGSRFAGGDVRRVLLYRHELGNRLLTFLTNAVTNVNLTDMETCYKAVRTSLLKSIPLVSNDFCIEPELTIKLAKRGARVFEVPISYSGRTYAEGKKINWRDGFKALGAISRFALSDKVYKEDPYGSHILMQLSRADRFNAWMADAIRPYCGQRVLEIGSGVGNLTRALVPRQQYVASDINPLYIERLSTLRDDRPYLATSYCDVTDFSSFPRIADGFDTVICLNVIEHVKDDRQALANIRRVLAPAGRAIVLVPQGQWNFGSLDQILGHHRRYSEADLRQLATDCDFEVEEMKLFNRVGTAAWFLNGKVLRRTQFGAVQTLALNALTPAMRAVDGWIPLPALSLIAILRAKQGAAPDITTAVAAVG